MFSNLVFRTHQDNHLKRSRPPKSPFKTSEQMNSFWGLSINCKSILFIPFRSVFWNWSGWECRVHYAMRKSKRFLHWSSGQDLPAVLKPTPYILISCQNAACSNVVFFFWRVDYALEGSMFWLSKCDFSPLFHTERSWHTLIDFLLFLNFWSSWFALSCKSIFFDLFWSIKLFFCG